VALLFNNAGIAPTGMLAEDGSLETARAVMETNYFGTLRMCDAFGPILGHNGGDREEVLADDTARRAKAGLGSTPPAYLGTV
jgi:NAD(P)-dependent dehydrogenase (short-subunit alcohol dehydrogenase family)